MSAVILPDGSLLFRLATRSIHIDGARGAVCVRDGKGKSELNGQILATFRISDASLVRLLTETPEHSHLYLEFESGETLDLGNMPSGEVSRHVAYSLAKIARCRVSTQIEATKQRRSPHQVPHFEAETRRLSSGLVSPEERDATLPRLGFHDTWREDFIRVQTAAATPQGPGDFEEPTVHDDVEKYGPQPPIPTISAEIVDDEQPTKPPMHHLANDLDDVEPTIRIDIENPSEAA